jgi:hypothetical protein
MARSPLHSSGEISAMGNQRNSVQFIFLFKALRRTMGVLCFNSISGEDERVTSLPHDDRHDKNYRLLLVYSAQKMLLTL